MLQCDQPDDFVVASDVAHSLEELVAMAFAEVGLNWRDHVDYDSSLARSGDIMCSLGDPSKAAKTLHWRPTIKLPDIVARMVRAEWSHLRGRGCLGNGAPGKRQRSRAFHSEKSTPGRGRTIQGQKCRAKLVNLGGAKTTRVASAESVLECFRADHGNHLVQISCRRSSGIAMTSASVHSARFVICTIPLARSSAKK